MRLDNPVRVAWVTSLELFSEAIMSSTALGRELLGDFYLLPLPFLPLRGEGLDDEDDEEEERLFLCFFNFLWEDFCRSFPDRSLLTGRSGPGGGPRSIIPPV